MDSADMDCCLKVHSDCQTCMMATIEVLRSVCGVYSVAWDVEKNMFRISGEVDPNILLKAVLRTGEHAELVSVKLKHPQLRYGNYNYGSYGPNNVYHIPQYRDGGYRSLANYPYYETNGHYPYNMPREPPPIEYLPSYNYNYNYNHTTSNDYQCPRQPSYNYNHTTPDNYQYPLPRATYVPSCPPQEYDLYDNYDSMSLCNIM